MFIQYILFSNCMFAFFVFLYQGVHCTHGFNRTGFLLIAFMVEKMDFSVDAALHEFARIRSVIFCVFFNPLLIY